MTAPPPPITQLRPAVPPEIAGVLERALAKTPADRFNPVAQFSDALRRPTGATPVVIERWPRRALAVATIVIVLGVVAGALVLRGRAGTEPLPVVGRTAQVTRNPGLEVDPAVSPDGQMVAYAAGPAMRMQILVRQVAGGRTVALTDDSSGTHRWPRWSPDGARIAYQDGVGIFVVPALGGAPRLVARAPDQLGVSSGSFTMLTGLTWSPDGQRIAFASVSAAGLYLVNVDGGEVTPLDAPPYPHSPAWSPAGDRIAVVSGNQLFVFGGAYFGNQGTSSIWVVPASGDPPVRVTADPFLDASPQWSSDGRYLFFLSDRGGSRDVYRVGVDDVGAPAGEPIRLTTGLGAQTISLTPDGLHLAYARLQSTSNIWTMPVPKTGPVAADALQPVTTGNQTIEDLDVTADGAWLVFDSDRGGNSDLYKLAAGGGEPIQLTTDPAGDYSATWSPDGGRIAFHSLRNGNRDVYTVEADGTGLTQRTNSTAHELDPDWSPDGKALVAESFRSTDNGSFLIIPLDRSAGVMRQLAGVGDFTAWSPAGDQIAYHATDGIEVIDPTGGEPRLLTSNAADGAEAFYGAWSPDGALLYYLAKGAAGWMIRVVARDGGSSRVLVRFDDPTRQPTRYGFATDGQKFYLTMGSHESDVWVMDLGRP